MVFSRSMAEAEGEGFREALHADNRLRPTTFSRINTFFCFAVISSFWPRASNNANTGGGMHFRGIVVEVAHSKRAKDRLCIAVLYFSRLYFIKVK